ncbi:MAG: porin [Kiritimatiellia bacterium]
MKHKVKFMNMAVALLISAATAMSAFAGGVKYKNEDGDYIKLGGRIQLQYHSEDPDDGDSEDELRFRRLRPYIEGSTHSGWKGKWQWDMGKGKVEIKDCYLQYKEFEGVAIGIGNMNFPFSREKLTSSKKQQLVERTFVGDHNYGTPDRQAGIHLTGNNDSKTVAWGLSLAEGGQDPSNKKLDFDTIASLNRGDDWSEGPMAGARLAIHPMGWDKPSQGDFSREGKAYLGVGAFTWANDDDNLDASRSNDVDSVTGFEIGGGIRGGGVSIDAQYNQFNSELVQAGITSGLYKNSETTLKNWAVEGGVMIVPNALEVVAGYQSQDADNYADSWNRASVGLNVFQAKHDIKYQLTYRMGENKDGKKGHDLDEMFVQAQYVF